MRKTNMLILSLVLLATSGVGLFILHELRKEDFVNHITLETDQVVHETMEIKDLGLYPGLSKEHSIIIESKINGLFTLSLDFIEKKDGELKHYIDVDIAVNDLVIESAKLSELFLNDLVSCTLNFASKNNNCILIRYTMPLDVGNEAQDTYTNFNINLTIEKI